MTTTSITVVKPLSQMHKKILEADLTGKYNTATKLSKAVGCHRDTIALAQQNPVYIQQYKDNRALEAQTISNIGKHTANEAKDALKQMKVLVNSSNDPILYGSYLKLLLDIGRSVGDTGWDNEPEEIDTEGARSDLQSLLQLAINNPSYINNIIDSYLLTGIPPDAGDIQDV